MSVKLQKNLSGILKSHLYFSDSRQWSEIITDLGTRDFIFSRFDTKIKVRNLQYVITV